MWAVRTVQGVRQSGARPDIETAQTALRPPQAGASGSVSARAGRSPAAPGPADHRPVAATAGALHLGPGLHLLEIAELGGPIDAASDLELPAIHLAPLPSEASAGIEIVANSEGTGAWLPAGGGTIVVQVPPEGGELLVTVYAPDAQPCPMPPIAVRRLDRDRPGGPPAATHAIDTEVVLHIQQLGDRRFVGQGWFGVRDQRLQIEAFSIRPLDTLSANEIEFMGYGPGRRQTPWVTDARLCGTRGRALPLTGFAIRLAPQAQERFDVAYEGAFFESGVVGPCRNGEPCLPPVADDPLAAINVRIIER
jgi:hypothetical protein